MSDGGSGNLVLSAVQVRAAQLEVQLRESLGEQVDDRLRQIAAAEPSLTGSVPVVESPREPDYVRDEPPASDETTASTYTGPSWVVLQKLLASMSHRQLYRHDPLPGMPSVEDDYHGGLTPYPGELAGLWHYDLVGPAGGVPSVSSFASFSKKIGAVTDSTGPVVFFSEGSELFAIEIGADGPKIRKY